MILRNHFDYVCSVPHGSEGIDSQKVSFGNRSLSFSNYSEYLCSKYKDKLDSINIVNQWLTYLDVFTELLRGKYNSLNKLIVFSEKTLVDFLSKKICSPESKNITIIKYYYTALASRANKSINPPDHLSNLPRWIPFSKKITRLFFRRFGESKNRKKFISFAHDLAYSRRCSPQVPMSFIEEANIEYKKSLTSIAKETLVNPDIIRTIVPIVFPGAKLNIENYCKHSNQCLSTSKSETPDGSIVQMDYIPLPKVNGVQIPAPYFSPSLIPDVVFGGATLLTEPLKIRTITTCSPEEYYAFKPIQSLLKDSMVKSKVLLFGRDAEEVDIENLVEDSKYFYGSNEKLYFISGDYKNATGYISPNTSKLLDKILLEIIGDFEIPVMENFSIKTFCHIWGYLSADVNIGSLKRYWINLNLWFKSFTDHMKLQKFKLSELRQKYFSDRRVRIAKYSNSKVIGQEYITQTNEQLMGDIKSFPLLCLLNYALWYDSNDGFKEVDYVSPNYEGKKQPIVSKRKIYPPCLINGDDFLAYTPLRIYEKWKENTTKFDFVLSIGKSYLSTDVAVINSTTFYYFNGKASKIRNSYLNLVFNCPSDRPINAIHKLITENNPELGKLFIKYNREKINSLSFNSKLNWFLEPHQGGLGLIHDNSVPLKVTHTQKRIMHLIRKKKLPEYHLRISREKKFEKVFQFGLHTNFISSMEKDYIPKKDFCLIPPLMYTRILASNKCFNRFYEKNIHESEHHDNNKTCRFCKVLPFKKKNLIFKCTEFEKLPKKLNGMLYRRVNPFFSTSGDTSSVDNLGHQSKDCLSGDRLLNMGLSTRSIRLTQLVICEKLFGNMELNRIMFKSIENDDEKSSIFVHSEEFVHPYYEMLQNLENL